MEELKQIILKLVKSVQSEDFQFKNVLLSPQHGKNVMKRQINQNLIIAMNCSNMPSAFGSYDEFSCYVTLILLHEHYQHYLDTRTLPSYSKLYQPLLNKEIAKMVLACAIISKQQGRLSNFCAQYKSFSLLDLYQFFEQIPAKKVKTDQFVPNQVQFQTPLSEFEDKFEDDFQLDFEMPEMCGFDFDLSPIGESKEELKESKEEVKDLPKEEFQLSKVIKIFYQESPPLQRKEVAQPVVLEHIFRMRNDVNPLYKKNKTKKEIKKVIK